MLKNEGLIRCISIIKKIIQCLFVFVWTYYVCIGVYNSIVFQIYEGLFPNGVSSQQTLPAELIKGLPDKLQIYALMIIVGYLLISVIEYICTKDFFKTILDICILALIALCIKIPEFLMMGFYIGNEIILQRILLLLLCGIGLLLIIKFLQKKRISQFTSVRN